VQQEPTATATTNNSELQCRGASPHALNIPFRHAFRQLSTMPVMRSFRCRGATLKSCPPTLSISRSYRIGPLA
jgi:hypothetical protein